MMGLFSVFCGAIYNEFFSVPMPFIQSCYKKVGLKFYWLEDCVYSFGIDYNWE